MKSRPDGAAGDPASAGTGRDPAGARGGGREIPEPRNLVPLLVESAERDYGLVWVLASRSELAPGAVFPARGSRWVVTGRSPSGATFTCREVVDELRR
jgi:hypothetical protein